jgi:hypothetical protein
MRTFITISVLLLIATVDVWATGPPGYDSSRRWVEEHNPKDETPATERIFVAHAPDHYAAIVRFRDGITLRDIIDQTKFKGQEVGVIILRSGKKATPVFDRVVAPSDKPTFEVKAHDMIWLEDAHSPRS